MSAVSPRSAIARSLAFEARQTKLLVSATIARNQATILPIAGPLVGPQIQAHSTLRLSCPSY
jgi:regulator of extracellular matrix RemA (YlzA/DUF370 family)